MLVARINTYLTTGISSFSSSRNPTSDPTASQFKRNVVADLGIAPFGYQVEN